MSIYESENWVTNTASKMLPHSSTSRNTGEASLQFTRLKSAILQDSKLLSAILQQTVSPYHCLHKLNFHHFTDIY